VIINSEIIKNNYELISRINLVFKMNLKKKINGGIVSYEDLNKWLEINNNKEGLLI